MKECYEAPRALILSVLPTDIIAISPGEPDPYLSDIDW